MSFRHLRKPLVGFLCILSAVRCVGTEATAPAGSKATERDLAFITSLYNIVEFDRRVIGQEMARSHDPRVAALAKDILDQANNFDAKVQPIAARDGITEPERVSLFRQSDMHSRVAEITGGGTVDFDQDFIADEIAAHRQILAQADDVMNEPSGDPELKALAQEGVQHLRTNLARLEELQAQLKKSG
jgi:predicted outer membrane protein